MKRINCIKMYSIRQCCLLMFYVTLLISAVSSNDNTRKQYKKHLEWINARYSNKNISLKIEEPLLIVKNKHLLELRKANKFQSVGTTPMVSTTSSNGNDDENIFAYETINNRNRMDNESYQIIQLNSSNVTENHQEPHETSTPPTTTSKLESSVTSTTAEIATVTDSKSTTLQSTTVENDNLLISSTSSQNSTEKIVELNRILMEDFKNKQNNITINLTWSKWKPWTFCSRTCGEGVQFQSRQCVRKTYKNGKRVKLEPANLNDCIGLYKRYRICSIMNCSDDENTDFRSQQCADFNNKLFGGQTYKWIPYIKEDSECELNCKPENKAYFAKLKDHVIDGTTCSKLHNGKSNHSKAVCIEGKCKAVHHSGFITGSFMNTGTVRCGSGSSVCRPFTNIFTKNPLPKGYIHVATLPSGASNITISKLKPSSNNYLALKTSDSIYVINGDYKISSAGTYDGVGSKFQYSGSDNNDDLNSYEKRFSNVSEWITSVGPLHEPVHLMVLSQTQSTNPGIKYEYLLPVVLSLSSEEDDKDFDYFSSGELSNMPLSSKLKAASTSSSFNTNSTGGRTLRKRKFSWKIIGFTPCSKNCGGGVQQPIVKCIRNSANTYSNSKRCAHLNRPILSENLMKCNSQPCPAFWKIDEWSDCRCGEPDERENQTREIKCVQELISGVVIQVNSGACNEERPISFSKCECIKHLKTPKLEVYKHKVRPNHHHQNDTHHHGKHHKGQHNSDRRYSNKKSGTWLVSEWSEQCSIDCGIGLQYRTVFCDRSPPNTDRCDFRQFPETTRECRNTNCDGKWFIGPWSTCSGDCFNSTKYRNIYCIKDNLIVDDAECNLKEKPETVEICKSDELTHCKPKWHSSDWTECNKLCGSGTQRRTIRCLEPDIKAKLLRDSNACKYAERPLGYRTCNQHKCSDTATTTRDYIDYKVDMLQNDENCRDEFPNCSLVIKAKLCGYTYYNQHCCQTCRLTSNEIY